MKKENQQTNKEIEEIVNMGIKELIAREGFGSLVTSAADIREVFTEALLSERQKAFEECPGIPGTPCKCETNYCQIWGIKQEKIKNMFEETKNGQTHLHEKIKCGCQCEYCPFCFNGCPQCGRGKAESITTNKIDLKKHENY